MRRLVQLSGQNHRNENRHHFSSLLLLAAVCLTVLLHGTILPFTHANTYDAFIHMFFANSYAVSWFDHWEPRWYLGFATTSYPPGSHMMIAALSKVISLRASFVVVQVFALVLLVVGVYRFSLLWVSPTAAGYAAMLTTTSTAVAETVHLFGQLPTTLSLGIFLNGVPSVFRWIRSGGWSNFTFGVLFAAGTTAAHHVTTLFGGVFFVLPASLHALNSVFLDQNATLSQRSLLGARAVGRGLLLAVFMVLMIVITVYPYWYWSITDPITQVPIPHGSRENFLDRLDLGLVFFLIPWGPLLLLLPFVIFRALTSNIWPLGLFILIGFLLGLGGTTPIARTLLRGAFDILTLDRFTFWAAMLSMPVAGHAVHSAISGRMRDLLRRSFGTLFQRALAAIFFAAYVICFVVVCVLPLIKPTQPEFIEPAPITQFLKEDDHDKWRYLTLGFGDQFAYLSSQTDAYSVDGNYHSARRLPAFTRFSVERLENSKYMGVAGIGSLSQFLTNAEHYNLKYIFSNDEFYDPILHFSGWNRITRLNNGIVVWEKPNISPIVFPTPRNVISFEHSFAWALIPPIFLTLTMLTLGLLFLKRARSLSVSSDRVLIERGHSIISTPIKIALVRVNLVLGCVLAVASIIYFTKPVTVGPEEIIEGYFESLDFRDYQTAYDHIDPESGLEYADFIFRNKWIGGLYASYGKITDINLDEIYRDDKIANYKVALSWLTSVKSDTEFRFVTLVKRGTTWKVLPFELDQSVVPVRVVKQVEASQFVPGKRQAVLKSDDKEFFSRPETMIEAASLVRYRDRYFTVGAIHNPTSLPADLMVESNMFDASFDSLGSYYAGAESLHTVQPLQMIPFKVAFEGTLSLQDYAKTNKFDPDLYLPPVLKAAPIDASVNVTTSISNRASGISLSVQNLKFQKIGDSFFANGTVVNSGTDTYSLVKLAFTFWDDRALRWVLSDFLNENLTPGKKLNFSIQIPNASEIEVIRYIDDRNLRVNGKRSRSSLARGVMPVDGFAGYQSISLDLEGMIYDAAF